MTTPKKTMNVIYISLGSNIKPRLSNLKLAFNFIEKKIGVISKYSKIYETPAWGFVSTSFLNTCILVITSLNTKETLQELQKIEIKLGRKAKKSETYEARPIDLDIIYSSEGIFHTEKLKVPHPLMAERKFVLVPLKDIAKDLKHPLLHLTTDKLLEICKDDSLVEVFEDF